MSLSKWLRSCHPQITKACSLVSGIVSRSNKDYHSESELGLIYQLFSSLKQQPGYEISQEEFENIWNEGTRGRTPLSGGREAC